MSDKVKKIEPEVKEEVKVAGLFYSEEQINKLLQYVSEVKGAYAIPMHQIIISGRKMSV